MVASRAERERQAAVAAWLNDNFSQTKTPREGETQINDPAFWPEASDLVKFLHARGFFILTPDQNRRPRCQ